MSDVSPPGDYYAAMAQLFSDLMTCLYTMQSSMAYQNPTGGPPSVLSAVQAVGTDFNALEQWLVQTMNRNLLAGNVALPTTVQTAHDTFAADMVTKGTPTA